ncbi:autophagy protein 16 [Hyaloscypha hepaticicola]|uniref:Autophagy protein 16 n=1 Tax=Hyaloscypha hepaticicola TaxID=2082293 RepID=A0A2J6Q6A5_9HELO|nr:autophagy protein 16 [Hyaloscypha hepaticicola]
MNSWRDDYIQALQDRDQRERSSYQKVDNDLIAAFTNLLDRTAALEAEKVADATSFDLKSKDSKVTNTANDGTAQIRGDLAAALRSNGQLQGRTKIAEAELVKLKAKSKSDGKLIEDLSKERAFLSQKLKDRDEELRGKTKLLDDVHDEVISLNLQLNMSEQRVKDLKAENKELIDRWMAYKGQEAEEMNKTLQGS